MPLARRGQPGALAEFDRISRLAPARAGLQRGGHLRGGVRCSDLAGRRLPTRRCLAAILTIGYGLHVALTGIRTCFVRSIGRPGLEHNTSLFPTILNVVLTVPFVLAFHVVGVVSATAVALTSASLYFVWLGRPFGLHDKLPEPRWWLAIALAAGVTILGEFGVRHPAGTAPSLSRLPEFRRCWGCWCSSCRCGGRGTETGVGQIPTVAEVCVPFRPWRS